jgi:hypothetical protein
LAVPGLLQLTVDDAVKLGETSYFTPNLKEYGYNLYPKSTSMEAVTLPIDDTELVPKTGISFRGFVSSLQSVNMKVININRILLQSRILKVFIFSIFLYVIKLLKHHP